MNCAEVGGLLDLLMDGELSDEQRQAMLAHGRECERCADAIRSTMQLKALLDGMDTEADVPLEAQAKWRGAVKAEAKRRKKNRALRWVASAAAAVVAVVGVGLTLNGGIAPRQDASSVALKRAVTADESADYAQSAREVAQAGTIAFANSAAEAADMPEGVPPEAVDSVVVEADGGAAVDAGSVSIEDDESGLSDSVEEAGEAPMPAALALRAPACQLSIRVKDVETACERIRDLAEEYEGEAEVQTRADGGADVYANLAADNADDFLDAVLPMDISDEPDERPELSGEGDVLLLLTVKP